MKTYKKLPLKLLMLIFVCSATALQAQDKKQPVDYVNPYIGNTSHLLVPTYPTVHLPNSMLRVYPERENYAGNTIKGLPIAITSHRGSSAFNLSPYQGDLKNLKSSINFGYDNEVIKPYYYSVDLDDYGIHVQYAPAHQSGLYELNFSKINEAAYLILNTKNGALTAESNHISGFQLLDNKTKIYLYLESEQPVAELGKTDNGSIDPKSKTAEGRNAFLVLKYAAGTPKIKLRYGISFISTEQAKKNLQREIPDYNLSILSNKGRDLWNKTLGKILVKGTDDNAKTIFYTALYRTYERMINLSEDGQYFSAFDGMVHSDRGTPFFTDDWIWDTYRATHPLRILIEPEMESNMLALQIESLVMAPLVTPTIESAHFCRFCHQAGHFIFSFCHLAGHFIFSLFRIGSRSKGDRVRLESFLHIFI